MFMLSSTFLSKASFHENKYGIFDRIYYCEKYPTNPITVLFNTLRKYSVAHSSIFSYMLHFSKTEMLDGYTNQ